MPELQQPHQTVTLRIDGREVTVAKGTNLLEAAEQAGIEIPYFCYHAGLSSPAVCRQCLVEIVGQGKLLPACYTPAAERMEVRTDTPKVRDVRRQMLEFTLVNHPIDCPICDQAGECKLQRLYEDHDASASRVDVAKRHKPKVVDIGPRVVLDVERCIHCTRCIRVCNEVAHQQQLGLLWRGDRQQIGTAPGGRLDHAYSLCTVDVCPVGALTSKDFRFGMRAWELWMVPSVCVGCATGCNIEVQFSRGQIYRLVPRFHAEVNRYWMCDQGRLTYKAARAPTRLARGVVDGKMTRLEEAMAEAARRLGQAWSGEGGGGGSGAGGDGGGGGGGGGRLGVVFSAQASNEDNYLLARLALERLGATRAYLAGRRVGDGDGLLIAADRNPNAAGALRCGRGKLAGMAELVEDVRGGEVRSLLVLGEELTLTDEEREALGRLDLLVVLASQVTEVTAQANVVLPMALWAEVDATVTNGRGLVQRLRPALEPPGEARPGWQLLAWLGKEMGREVGEYASAEEVFAEMRASVPGMEGAEWGERVAPVQLRFANSRG